MRFIVHSSDVRVNSGTSAKTGRDYHIREQESFVELPGRPYPVPVKIRLQDNEAPYEPGIYVLHPDSYFVGRFGDLQVRARLDRASRQPLEQRPQVARAVNS